MGGLGNDLKKKKKTRRRGNEIHAEGGGGLKGGYLLRFDEDEIGSGSIAWGNCIPEREL